MYTLSQEQATDLPDNLRAGHEVLPITGQVTLRAGTLTQGAVLGKIDDGETGEGEFLSAIAAAEDGSAKPYAVLLHDADAAGEAQQVTVLLAGIVNEAALSFGAGHDADSVRWSLREVGLYLRKTVGA